MADVFASGAYVIRNKKTSTVLHIENPRPMNAVATSSVVLAFGQDENQYREQQIWWIESVPGYEDGEGGGLYSIINTSTGNALQMQNEVAGYPVIANRSHGAPWQRWKFRREDDENGIYYSLTTQLYGQKALAIFAQGMIGGCCYGQDYVSGHYQQCWEFITPVVAFPPGWFQIQNVFTGNLLSHTYLEIPPVLSPPPASEKLSKYRESWGTQWCLARLKTYNPKTTLGNNAWVIRNRLTDGLLANKYYTFKGSRKVSIGAWQMPQALDFSYLTWKLELDPASNWRILNYTTGFLLAQTKEPLAGGMEAACVDKKLYTEEVNKSWALIPPALETKTEVTIHIPNLGGVD